MSTGNNGLASIAAIVALLLLVMNCTGEGSGSANEAFAAAVLASRADEAYGLREATCCDTADSTLERSSRVESASLFAEDPRIDGRGLPTIALRRTACAHGCTAYRIEIDGDGNVLYEGRASGGEAGVRRARLSRVAVDALVARFESAGFFALAAQRAPDLDGAGSTELRFDDGARSRTLRGLCHRASDATRDDAVASGRYQAELDALARAVDYACASHRWKVGTSALDAHVEIGRTDGER